MLTASYIKHELRFLKPAGTSRGVLLSKPSWYLVVWDSEQPDVQGIGECSIIPGLSPEDATTVESALLDICQNIVRYKEDNSKLNNLPSVAFALDTALLDLQAGGNRILFPSAFTDGAEGLPINGLIWMGTKERMLEQIRNKIEAGFRVLKMKIGAIDFDDELEIIKEIRRAYKPGDLEIRLDANGAWECDKAMDKLNKLSAFSIHSLEQPIRQGQIAEMAEICIQSPIAIALDEDLIGISDLLEKKQLLQNVRPAYIILKPSLIGGFKAGNEWIRIAEDNGIGWWITSALESNIGLNAIAQWTATLGNRMPQGLGTGSLYENNIPSPLYVDKDSLYFRKSNHWDFSGISEKL